MGLATGISVQLSPAELRRFGVTVAIPLVLLAALGVWRGHTILPAFLGGLAAALGGLALLAPGLLSPIHTLWMGGVHALAWVNTRVLLGLVYFLIMTTTGVVMRLMGRDPLIAGSGIGPPIGSSERSTRIQKAPWSGGSDLATAQKEKS